ncbi:phage tail assembly protein [Trinickia dinghuensis]|uniref:Phage tail assembly protein n=1 Tax=Trinickia dinghuensis TaxID=2291023 RepID=A0A3D8K1C3_9BURK|nr:phage tail assembly protein [Trinickia dinghuensis]RDU99233.1 phage tail assembly protein [Trinickia dinghuensis]
MSQAKEKVIVLPKPLELGPLKHASILLREPTVDELDRSTQTKGSVYAVNAALISMVSGIPLTLIRTLGKTGYEEAVEYLKAFDWTPPKGAQQLPAKTVVLKQPITLNGDTRTYDSLALREPTVDELDQSAQVEGTAFACNAELISLVSGAPVAVIRKIGKANYEEATAYLSGFTWRPQQSGETSGTAAPTSPSSGSGDQTTPAV